MEVATRMLERPERGFGSVSATTYSRTSLAPIRTKIAFLTISGVLRHSVALLDVTGDTAFLCHSPVREFLEWNIEEQPSE